MPAKKPQRPKRIAGVKYVPPLPKIIQQDHTIDGVPTAEGLAVMGRQFAIRTDRGIRITDLGHALLGEHLKAKADAAIERGEHIWVRPPNSGRVLPH